jgi:hypothetical protein
MRSGFGGRMHPVLRNFVHAACGRLLMSPIKMVERARALADGESVLDGFLHISFCEQDGIAKRASRRKL